MSTIKLSLRKHCPPGQNPVCEASGRQGLGPLGFAEPDPTYAEFTTGVALLETGFNVAVAGRKEAQRLTQVQNDLEAALDALLTKQTGYVQDKVLGGPVKIKAADLDVRDAAAAVGDLPVPDFTATSGDHDGEIDLSWNRVRGARSYLIEQSPDGQAWKSAGVSTKSSFTVAGLTSGARMWFRVAAIGAAGQGPWSDPASKVVP